MKNKVEKLFRYLKERTITLHNKMSTRDHIQGITNPNLFTIYYQNHESRRWIKMPIRTLPSGSMNKSKYFLQDLSV